MNSFHNNYPESIDNRFVLFWVCLDAALDQIQGDDHGVGDTTGEKTSNTAENVELGTTIFNLCNLKSHSKIKLNEKGLNTQ